MDTGREAIINCTAFGLSAPSGLATPSLSFEVRAGEMCAITGRKASGKSILLEYLAGVRRPGLTLQGNAQVSPNVRVGFVPQDARLAVLPTDRVWGLLGQNGWHVRAKRLLNYDLPRSAADEANRDLLRRLRVDPDRTEEMPFRDLCAAERRIVILVAQLVADPDLLLLDGWDEMMDHHGRLAIAEVLHERVEKGMALLLSSRADNLRDFGTVTRMRLGDALTSADLPLPLLQKTEKEKAHKHPLLEVRGLAVQQRRPSLIGKRPAAHLLRGVSLFVRHGESLVIFGGSGAGKSTLLHAIAGLRPVSRGKVLVSGNDVTHAGGSRARRLRRDVQLVFQDAAPALDGRRSVAAHLYEAMTLKGASQGNPSEWLERLGLSPLLLHARADQLSAAESQRIDLARSLVLRPRLVLYDEPRVAAANTDGGSLAALLRAEKSQGRSFLIATSCIELASSLADRIAIIHSGKIVELGESSEVLTTPANPITEALLEGRPLTEIDPTEPHEGCPHVAKCSRRQLPRCAEQEPSLSPLIQLSPDGATSRHVACFYPLI